MGCIDILLEGFDFDLGILGLSGRMSLGKTLFRFLKFAAHCKELDLLLEGNRGHFHFAVSLVLGKDEIMNFSPPTPLNSDKTVTSGHNQFGNLS